jgi:2,3-bisphosphoglycerate-dependent phosphoglycerate mutase
MEKFYEGKLSQKDAVGALLELKIIKFELASLQPNKIIWDISDRSKTPPWGSNISRDITNLSNYFVTSTGRDFITSLEEIFEELRDRGGVAKIVKM